MHPCGKGEKNKYPTASPFLPCSSQQLKASHPKQTGSGEKSIRVKRRRTRRERNYVKFGRNGTDCAQEQRPSCMGLQKALPPFWKSQLKVASFKGICGAKPVIITQNRLSHLGMFNKEVKSVNIERLLNPRCEQEFVEVTPLRRDSGVDMQLGEDSQAGKSGGSDQKSVPSERPGSRVNNPGGMNEDSVPVVVPAVSAVLKEHRAPVHAVNTGSQSLAAPAAVEVNQQSEPQIAEPNPCKSNASLLTSEKENVPPVCSAGAESHEGKSLARRLAHDFQKLLDLKAIFPGRNLINETRRTIITALLKQKQKLPKVSDFALYKKLAGSSRDDALQAGFKTPAGREQELRWESKSTSGGSRNSGQGASLKKRRGVDLFFLTSPIPSPTHTTVRTDEGRRSLRADMDFFMEAKGFDQQNFCLAALQTHPHLLTSQQVNSREESSFALEEQCLLQEPLLRTVYPWQQGLRDTPREPRSRQERSKTAYRPLQKQSVPQSLPFTTWDSWSLANATTGDKCSSQFPVVESQPHSYINELRSEQWSLQEAEPTAAHRQYLLQEQCSSQTQGLGLRATERAASESQTSFDVLKSIWSPNVPSSEARFPVPQTLACPFLAHQPTSLREPNPDQEEFLHLYSTSPGHFCSSHRKIPPQEIHVPSRCPQNGRQVRSVPANPRTHCQKAAIEKGRASNSCQPWGRMEASMRTRGTREKGFPSSRDQVCCPEMLSQMEGLQQLQLLQKLPMSYFPPSEALEDMNSPFQGHVMGQSSPEPWAFPRMKLY